MTPSDEQRIGINVAVETDDDLLSALLIASSSHHPESAPTPNIRVNHAAEPSLDR